MAIMAVWCALVILVCAAHGHAEGAWVLWERGNTRVFDKNHQEGEKPTKTLKAKAAAPDFLSPDYSSTRKIDQRGHF
jgi:hypothetical protein